LGNRRDDAISFFGAGCYGANHYAVFRKPTFSEDRAGAIILDAQQRAILTSPIAHPTANNESLVMYCAEPSPDALMVLSQALAASGSGTIFGKAQFQGELRQAMAEAATQLGNRTESIQLLRDASFRLCEARMNGFITSGTFPVELNRLQDGMVTTLAIERLASPNENGAPVTISAPVLGDLSITQTTGKGAPSAAVATVTPTKTPKPTSTPTSTAAAYKSNDAVDSAPELANSRPDQRRDIVGNAPDPGFVKVAASAPTPTSTPTRTATPTPSATPTQGAKPKKKTPAAASSQATKNPSEAEPPVSPEVANAVRQMVSMYLYKNLEESCLTLAASELQANFQVGYKLLDEGVDPSIVNQNLSALLEVEKAAHIWTYCGQIFEKYKQDETAQAPKTSPTPSATPTAATSRPRRTIPRAAATASFVTSSYR